MGNQPVTFCDSSLQRTNHGARPHQTFVLLPYVRTQLPHTPQTLIISFQSLNYYPSFKFDLAFHNIGNWVLKLLFFAILLADHYLRVIISAMHKQVFFFSLFLLAYLANECPWLRKRRCWWGVFVGLNSNCRVIPVKLFWSCRVLREALGVFHPFQSLSLMSYQCNYQQSSSLDIISIKTDVEEENICIWKTYVSKWIVNIQLRAFHGKLQGRKTSNTSLRIQCSWVVRDVKMFDTTGINLNKSQHFNVSFA